jgi:hypothetical protein
MSKPIELTAEQLNTLMTVLSRESLRFGKALEGQGTYTYMIEAKATKEDIDALITHLTADEPPGVKSVDEARSILTKAEVSNEH